MLSANALLIIYVNVSGLSLVAVMISKVGDGLLTLVMITSEFVTVFSTAIEEDTNNLGEALGKCNSGHTNENSDGLWSLK